MGALGVQRSGIRERRIAAAEGIDDVVEFREGDLLVEEFPGQQDVVVLGNILHHFDEEHADAIVGRFEHLVGAVAAGHQDRAAGAAASPPSSRD